MTRSVTLICVLVLFSLNHKNSAVKLGFQIFILQTNVVCPVIDIIDDNTLEYRSGDSWGLKVGKMNYLSIIVIKLTEPLQAGLTGTSSSTGTQFLTTRRRSTVTQQSQVGDC